MQDIFEIKDGILTAYLGEALDPKVPEGVHTIGDGAFKGLGWLLSVELPSTLKRIGAEAFKGCRKLKEIALPKGLEEIGEYAFHRCHDLEQMICPDTLTRVDQCAFLYCDCLKTVVLEGPKRLEKGMFSHNLALESVALNRDVDFSNFYDEVFEGCVNLQRISLSGEVFEPGNLIEAMSSHSEFPEVIRAIARGVFHSMKIEDGEMQSFNINLKSVNVPEGITSIGKSCFFDKKGIVSITFPATLREIRANAFLNCISLSEITFQNGNVIPDEKAFRGCSALRKVIVNGTVYTIAEDAESDGAEAPGSGSADERDGTQELPELIERIRDQVFADYYISGNVLIRYLGKEERIRVPKEVRIIGERAFFGNEQLKTVILPNGLTEIREQAFAGCLTLQTVAFPQTLRRVEREAFAECKKLLSSDLPASVEYIGEYAFRRCFSLKPFVKPSEGVQIHPFAFYLTKQMEEAAAQEPQVEAETEQGETIAPYAYAGNEDLRVLNLTGIRRIGKYAFSACPNLEKVSIDAPECELDEKVFATCPNLKKVQLNVKKLGRGTFAYCRNLSEVRLSGVSTLPAECFAGCYRLEHFDAKEVTGMEARCFDECRSLNTFDFMGIRRIGERAFERCDSLKSVCLDSTECAYHAFADCAGLEQVSLTSNTRLGSGAFTGCTQVKTVVFDSVPYTFSRFSDSLNHVGNPYPLPVREVIASVYSCFDIRDRSKLLHYSQDATKVTIPQDVEEIDQDVFRDHSRLSEVVIPASVKRIGSHAFAMTAWLERERKRSGMVLVNGILLDAAEAAGSVVLPAQTVRVASWCFAGNARITELTIPSDRIGIEPLAFRNCLNLKKITDPEGHVYTLSSVSDLNNADYPDLIRRIFSECINCFKLDSEGELVESTGNLSKLVFPEGIRFIGDGVYKDCHLLESIVLAQSTTGIGKCAFENSKWLRSVSGAGSVTEIGAQAFSGCQSLETIDLSDRLQKLGNRCFEHCASLWEIHLSGQLKEIGERTFFRCKALTEVRIPASVKAIGAEAFAFCDSLTEVQVSQDTEIHEKAFAYCDRVVIRRY